MDRTDLMGPPNRGPWVVIRASGIDLQLEVNDEIDSEIVQLAMDMAQRRRYAKAPDVLQPSLSTEQPNVQKGSEATNE